MKNLIRTISLILAFMLITTTVFANGRINQTLENIMGILNNEISVNEPLTTDFEKGIIDSRFTTSGKVSLLEEEGNTSVVLNGRNCSMLLDEVWSDFVCQFDVTMVDYGWLALKFRKNDNKSYTLMLGNLAHNQQFSMRKLNPEEVNLSTLGKKMSLNETYNVKLVVQKGRFELYVDGLIFITGFDEDFQKGSIEFMTTDWSGPTAKIDNIHIEEIPKIPVESISTDTPDLELYVGEKLRLPMDIYPFNSYNTDVELYSDDETVVKCEDYSAIGVSAGKATIKCTTADGGYSIKYNVTVKKKTFDDIEENWAKEYIEELAQRDMISGDGTGNFKPENNLTRAEAVALAVKMVGYDLISYKDTDNMPYVTGDGFGFANRGIFDDISSNDWYADLCQTAYTAGILDEGLYPDGSFVPNENITREEAFTLFLKAYEKAIGVEEEYKDADNVKDMEDVSDYARKYINAAAETGVLTEEYIRPKDNLTRAEAAAIECRVLNNIDEVGAIPVVPLDIEIEAPRPKQGIVVNLADFGAKPYDPEDPGAEKFDNYEALQNAMAYCVEVDASKLIVPTGWYYFNTAGLFRFDFVKDFIFDGQGSTFVLGTVSNFFRLEGCERIELKNITFDWDWDKERLADIIEITARDSENQTLDIKYLSCDYVEEDKVSLNQCASVNPVTYTLGDPDGIEKQNIALSNVERLSDNEFRVTYSNAGLDERLRKGSVVRAVYKAYAGTVCIAYDTKDFTVDNMTIYSSVGIGFCFYNGMENWQIINTTINKRPGYELTHPISSSQDGIQVNNMTAKGHFKIENCNLGYMNDDGVNVHQNISVGIELYEDDRYSVLAKKADWSKPIRAGERVGFLNPDFTDTGFESTVVDTEYIDNVGIRLILEDKVPQNFKSNTIVVNRNFGSCWGIIRNNSFEGNYGRGLLVRGDNILIENNTFKSISNSAIMTEIEITSQWVSGIPSSNLLFRNNTIESCDENETKSVVRFTSNLASGYSPATHISENILFENNTFKNVIGKAFTFDWAENVTLRNNKFIEFKERANVIENRGKVDLTNSKDIKIYGNTYEKSQYIDGDANSMYIGDENTTNVKSYDNNVQ